MSRRPGLIGLDVVLQGTSEFPEGRKVLLFKKWIGLPRKYYFLYSVYSRDKKETL